MKNQANLITLEDPHSVHAEIYRSIRTNIEYSSVDKIIKVINVTSSVANEAKTTTACNLAVIHANKYKKVLIIDLDLRNPSVHKVFNVKNNIGLTDLLVDFLKNNKKTDISQYVVHVEHPSVTNQLYVLPVGTSVINPTEILGSKKIAELIDFLKDHFDFIIFDSSPSGLIIDGVLTSKIADGTVFIVESGKTKIDVAQKTIEQLKSFNVHILGVILTKVPVKSKHYGYYGHGNDTNNRIKIDVE